MTPELIEKYDQRLPRYTSYPTAPHFGASVDEATYRGWLGELDRDASASVYLHVPFCRQLCWYCGCHTSAVNRTELVTAYGHLLGREIEFLGGAIGFRLAVHNIHWGGGTPSILSQVEMELVMEALDESFAIAPDAEISIELDPRELTSQRSRQLAQLGVNRASLGVQDFDPKVQQAVNRIQPYEMTAGAVAGLREAGINSINFDLMYGLPYQTVESVRDTAERAADLRPERIALFGYAHVPWMKRRQTLIPEAALPGPYDRFEQSEIAAEALTRSGYVRVGLDHFALRDDRLAGMTGNDRVTRNFQGYTTDENPVLLGVGVSSIGRLPQGYVQNTTEVSVYRDRLRYERLPTVRGIGFDDEDRLRGAVIERLMCDLSVDLAAEAARFGRSPDCFESELRRLEPFVADGIAVRDGLKVQVTEEGRPLLRTVAALFDAYLAAPSSEAAPPRHSKAV